MNQQPLTAKQSKVLHFMQDYLEQYGIAPTYNDIAQFLNVKATGSIRKYIKILEEKGYIESNYNKARGIRIKSEPRAPVDVGFSLVGKIVAGRPVVAFENIESVDLNAHFMESNQKRYLLEVYGDSMIDAGIYEKDWVLVQSQVTAANGDIVVALVDGYDATLKRYRQHKNGDVTLIPENSTMQPMHFSAERVQIQGKVVALMRQGVF